MLGVNGCLDVHGRQQREDVGLQDRHDDLEQEDGDRQHPPQHAEDAIEGGIRESHDVDVAGDQQQGEHDVAGHEVGEEPDRQAERTHQEDRHELDDSDQPAEGDRDIFRPDDVAEVAEAPAQPADDAERAALGENRPIEV